MTVISIIIGIAGVFCAYKIGKLVGHVEGFGNAYKLLKKDEKDTLNNRVCDSHNVDGMRSA